MAIIHIDPIEVEVVFIIFGEVVDARISKLSKVIWEILNIAIFTTVLSIGLGLQFDLKVDLSVFRICCTFL